MVSSRKRNASDSAFDDFMLSAREDCPIMQPLQRVYDVMATEGGRHG